MPHSGSPLGRVRLLLVEDSELDAELLVEQLLEAGLDAEFLRVDSADDMRAALAGDPFDLVLSDMELPGFSGYQALEILRSHDPRLPFVFFSGTIGEDAAVKALQHGASDYVLKHSPARLPAAVARAIREARTEREREQAERELMRSQRLDCLAMLAAGLSHDLRNILQPLLIVPDLLSTYSDDPKILRLGAVISESGKRGHEMADSMLSFVRGSRKASETISVAALFSAVQLLLQGSLSRQIQLTVEPPAEDLLIEGNYTEFQQCLINLCLNGIQAMAERGGRLTLSARPTVAPDGQHYVVLRVADEGTGMDDATRQQLFTPFFTTKASGTGLGLMSCKRIVEAARGRIEVSSVLGEGTSFELHLPAPAEEWTGAEDAAFLDGGGRRILVVDGDATRLSLLGNALAAQGYDPMMAPDGANALQQIARDGLPAVAIIDDDILLLSAADVLAVLNEEGFDGPVIRLKEPGVQADDRDCAATLVKPVQVQSLFAAIEHALGLRA
ncbi:hybrid sensor histidine kinase/response regulator [Pseudoxanthomonas sp.]|uniref:hybrid sensor histidine kinase/response regulator n=1 Tax=Pseudoxanthomonas sp. TaxID=1871049 RepID=UPI002E114A64|nr:response regulator [Pseudoxanthomonas sp.]